MNSENKVHVTTTTTKQQEHNSSGNTQHFQHNVVLPVVVLRTCGATGSRNKRCRKIKKWQTSTPKKKNTTTTNNNKSSLNHFKVLVHD
jgi:hypothetical protein